MIWLLVPLAAACMAYLAWYVTIKVSRTIYRDAPQPYPPDGPGPKPDDEPPNPFDARTDRELENTVAWEALVLEQERRWAHINN